MELTNDQIIAMEIAKQLGGQNRLKAMLGARNFQAVKNGLSFHLSNRTINYIKITLNSMDLYDIEMGLIRGDNYKVKSTHENIYNDQLKGIIEQETGMYLSL